MPESPAIGLNDRVYISGAMSGYVDNNFNQFNRAEQELRIRYGCRVANPAHVSLLLDADPDYEDCMTVDLALVRCSQVLVTLPGWEKSRGASREVAEAKKNGLRIYPLEQVLNVSIAAGARLGENGFAM